MTKKIIILFALFYSYAVIRYQFGKNLWELSDYFYTLNKAIAWLAGTLVCLTLLSQRQLDSFMLSRKGIGLTGYFLALIHITSSFILLSPCYFPTFYNNHELSLFGWISISFGILTGFFFTLAFLGSINLIHPSNIKFGKLGILCNFLHVFNIGFLKWFPMQEWTFYMPPITLLFVIEVLVVLFVRRAIQKPFPLN